MSRQQTVLSGSAGLGAKETGDWHPVTVPQLLLSVYDEDDFASGVVVEYDLSDDPDDVATPVKFAPMHDDNGVKVQLSEKRSDVPLTFIAEGYRIRARTVGGDGNTEITTRINY